MTFHLITKIAVKQVKLLENAYIFLNSVTFEQRLARHLAEFKEAGFIVLSGDDVRLYPNGDVQKGKHTSGNGQTARDFRRLLAGQRLYPPPVPRF